MPTFPLFERTARWFERANASLLGQLPCSIGCSQCCLGIFPVTILDEQTIQVGLSTLPDDRRRRIEKTAAVQVKQLTQVAPQLITNRFIDQWPEKEMDRMIEQCEAWPCPALEQDGRCGLYEFRPLVCRSMGIPQDDSGGVHGACAVQTAVPLIRLSNAMRDEENRLAALEAEQLEMLRHRQGTDGEEMLLPFAFLPQASVRPAST